MARQAIESLAVTEKHDSMIAQALDLVLDMADLERRHATNHHAMSRNPTWRPQGQSAPAGDCARWALLKQNRTLVDSTALKMHHQDLAS